MAKIQSIYECSKCGAQSPKWSGRCFDCGAWNTLVENTVDQKEKTKQEVKNVKAADIIDFSQMERKNNVRLKTNIGEIDRVLGGGVVPGSLILLSGEPGIGKSTVLAQIVAAIEDSVYVSGEESAEQVSDRMERLGISLDKVKFISETNTEKILSAIRSVKPKLVIVDSIQTVYSSMVESEAGGISQIRAATMQFLELAKESGIAIVLVGHITKDGQVAGPKSLEHIVDTVIYLETEATNDYRILRSTKNRFGSVNEIGIFEMTGKGFVEIKNPGAIFIDTNSQQISGSVISSIMEGTRPFLVEIQALVTKTVFGYPQRKASGYDLNRLQVLTAVLSKRAGINLTNQDVILNVVGGMRINDPALDLAVCLAIASSLLNQVIDKKTIIIGEVGLGGEVRKVSRLKERLEEAKKLGFEKAIIPDVKMSVAGLEIRQTKSLVDIVRVLLS